MDDKRIDEIINGVKNSLEQNEPSESKEGVLSADAAIEENEVVEEVFEEIGAKVETKKHKVKKKKKKKALAFLIAGFVVIGLSAALSVLIIFGFKDIYGLELDESVEKTIYIEKGSTTEDIANALYENGIIEQPLLYRVYCKINEIGVFQYGLHTFKENMAYEDINIELKKLVQKNDVVEITVIEGWTFYDIAKELKDKGVISDITAFTKAVERMSVSYDFVKDAPETTYRYYKYEGYFYPDKYEFYVGTDDYEGIAKKFFANFEKQMDTDIKNAVKGSKYSFDEILTIASLIQAEAGNINEMGKVSSVFHNRLNSTLFPNLQSDVTINYVENAIKPTIAYPNQDLYDAYNTYKCTGLMPGPICNPSKAAIRAALYPENTNYYYFVTDNTGRYYYSTTYAQHQRNCATAQRVNANLKGQ